MSTTKWIPGVTVVDSDYGSDHGPQVWNGAPSQRALEDMGWRAVDPPVDAPAEKRERRLAEGWALTNHSGNCHVCMKTMGSMKAPWLGERYAKPSGKGGHTYLCPPCAEAAGAFAPPAPAKTCKPGCGGPVSPSNRFIDGWRTDANDPHSKRDYCSIDCLRAAEKAARAKPAEPKPAPTMARKAGACECGHGMGKDGRCEKCGGAFPKPAPAEKAKRSVVGVYNGCDLERERRIRANQDRDDELPIAVGHTVWRDVLTANLAREKPPARIFPETRYNATLTDAHGKLSRLVESGVRADARLDETRFEAGLRGRR